MNKLQAFLKRPHDFLTTAFIWIIIIFLLVYLTQTIFNSTITCKYQEQIVQNQTEYLSLQAKKYDAIRTLGKHWKDSTQLSQSLRVLNDEIKQDSIAWRSGAEAMMRDTQMLLDLHMNSIDRQYSVLTLWSAVMMILFLIFSFYAIFKLEDTLRQSKQMVHAFKAEVREMMKDIKKEAKTETLKIVQEAEKQRSLSQLLSEALNAYNEKKYEVALTKVNQALTIADDSNKEQFYILQGLVYEGLENKDKAINSFKEAIALNEKSSIAYFALANTYNDMKEYNSAIENYEKAIELKPNDPEAYNNWGNALSNLGKMKKNEELFKQSYQKYEKAIELNPNDPNTYYNWGNALSDLAKIKKDEELFKQSVQKYEKAIELDPNNAKAYYNWGSALSDLAKMKKDEELFKQSYQKYEKAIELNPNDADTYYNWGSALYYLAKIKKDEELFKQSFQKYEKAIELDPNNAKAYNNWGSALSDLAKMKDDEGLFKQSVQKYEKAIELDPDSAIYYSNYACAYLNLARIENNYDPYKQKIEEMLIKAESTQKGEGSYNLACLYSCLKETEQAFEWLEKALNINSKVYTRNQYEEDEDFSNIKSDSRFKELLDRYYPEDKKSDKEK